MVLPTLLLTRPADSAKAFAASLNSSALSRVRLLIAPLMEISSTGLTPSIAKTRGVIFTSANGVVHAPKGNGRPAFCVGVQTTEKAIAKGWAAQRVGNTAQELIATLLADPPDGPLLHLSGCHTRGDIAETLTAAGIATERVMIYEQKLLGLDAAARSALEGPCIVPVFSPRSAMQLAKEAHGQLEKACIVALSEAVAAPLAGEKSHNLTVLPAPQAAIMRQTVENLCLNLSLP
ncbi:uroporphyrinogen-III synthase [Sulfitobacter sp. S223]|uniref:uroporphyrinogen-III synthase n=1 Tax=Sulfitobacter sp. S223 TaxID=2867023 RepID=UPI0021A8F49A|nr:uroporphyrinogen-III synthase [Sulfitobacter sp. S223]UWR26348.1 uroporphyrinogen-III synthase [Sulfitobacter sp. S223]